MTTITVEGMSCEHCSRRSGRRSRVSGVTDVRVDREAERASVDADADVDVEDLVRAVEDAGYTAHA